MQFESLTELRRSVAEVRGKIRGLGNVNVGAIEEYKEVKERYDFLKAQVTDVEKAKSELTRMIAELCSEMEELFTTSFKQINTHFQQIFKELFGGGHARLYLSDESNVLGIRHRDRGLAPGQGHQEPERPFRRRAGAGRHLDLLRHPQRQSRALLLPG